MDVSALSSDARARVSARRLAALVTAVALGIAGPPGWVETTVAQGRPGQGSPAAPVDPWPRQVKLGGATAVVYQPQVDSWQGNALQFRAVVAIKAAGSAQEVLGTIWATARTEVDRVARMVTLRDLTLTRSDFPTLADRGAAYMGALQGLVSSSVHAIALDRLEESLAASGTVKLAGFEVSNAPPRVIVSESPAILVPIDGPPVQQPVVGTRFERVINTRALILRETGSTTYYLHVYDGWLYAGAIPGPWYQPMVPPGIEQVCYLRPRRVDTGTTDPGRRTPMDDCSPNRDTALGFHRAGCVPPDPPEATT